MTVHRPNFEARFWTKVDRRQPDECWPWKEATGHFGYGVAYATPIGMRMSEGAHRVAFVLSGGVLSAEAPNVLHSCDNPPCCKPAHLRAGNQKDNWADCISRGRKNEARGERRGSSKYTAEQVARFKAALKASPQRQIKSTAREHGIAYESARSIVKGRLWAHVEPAQ